MSQDITHAELMILQTTLDAILKTLKELQDRWIHSESDARFVTDTLRDMSRHVRDISLNLKGI